MATKGLEKITEKIIADAMADAQATRQTANDDCDSIRAEWQAKTERMKAGYEEAQKKEEEAIRQRGQSSSAMELRNIELQNRADRLDETFRRIEGRIENLPSEQTCRLLAGLLIQALRAEFANEDENRALYGEEEAQCPEMYEILLNPADREAYGEQMLRFACEAIPEPQYSERMKKVQLSEQTSETGGGFILRYGNIESNCTFPVLFAQLREEKEAEVSKMLFS